MTTNCKNCNSQTFALDLATGNRFCLSCGLFVQDFNHYVFDTVTADGPLDTSVCLCAPGCQYDYSYHNSKTHNAYLVDDVDADVDCLNDEDDESWEIEDLERLKVSSDCLSAVFAKYLEEYFKMKTSNKRVECSSEYFDYELSKKHFLDQILENDVGLKKQNIKEKIKAAKLRIEPLVAEERFNESLLVANSIDWEDFVVETLLLHDVKEEEIEKGYYNALLDLNVF